MKEKNNGELVIHVIFAIGIHTPHSTTLGSHWLLNIFSVFYPFGLAIHSSQKNDSLFHFYFTCLAGLLLQ